MSGCQQFSHIVNKNPERYRGVLVSYEGRKELRVKTNDLFSKQADWNGLINGFTAEIGRFWAVVPCRPSAPLHPSHCAALVGPPVHVATGGHGSAMAPPPRSGALPRLYLPLRAIPPTPGVVARSLLVYLSISAVKPLMSPFQSACLENRSFVFTRSSFLPS